MGVLDWLRLRPSNPRNEPVGVPPRSGTAVSATVSQPGLSRLAQGFAVVDVETTGLSPKSNRVLELAIVRCDPSGAPVDEWVTRFNPAGPVGATHIHGITDADVRDAPFFAQVLPDITDRLRGLAVVAHNARFDLAFLRAEYSRAGWSMPWLPSVCTLEASRLHLPDLPRRRLPDCCAAARVTHHGAHSALGDAHAAAALLAWYLAREARSATHRPCAAAMGEAYSVVWPAERSRAARQEDRGPARVVPTPRVEAPRAPRRRLASLLKDFPLVDVLGDDASAGKASYLELLAEVLEDGVLDDGERSALAELAVLYDFDGETLAAVHRAFIAALARQAVDDGRVVVAEWDELRSVAATLDVAVETINDCVRDAEAQRLDRLTARLRPLPGDWTRGEPLRVGDTVVFTGCESVGRDRLERRAERAGLKVTAKVSGRTKVLVSDETVAGTKAADAERLGTRVVTPDEFVILVKHIQPPVAPVGTRPVPGRAARPPVTVQEPTPASAQERPDVAPSIVRSWARENGFVLGDRGRLPKEAFDAYFTAMTVATTGEHVREQART